MRFLGISAYYHDSAAALVEDGGIVAAAQEERFTRKKHDSSFPKNAIAYCLEEAGVKLDELDHVVFYDKPFLKFERLLETYIALAPRGFRSFSMAIPLWLKEKLFQKSLLKRELRQFGEDFDIDRLLFCEHHLSHAASAFYPSPFEDAAVLTMDGVGEWATTSAAIGSGKKPRGIPGDLLPAFTRLTLFGIHLLHRLQSQFRRIQAHGTGTLRRAKIQKAHPRQLD
jgi:carbamoyltransferase